MEERYMNIHRRRPEGRSQPPRRAARRTVKARRGGAASVAMGFYKGLVIVSALIVAVYIGFSLMVKAPEQKTLPPPEQKGAQTPVTPGVPAADGDGQDPDGPPGLNRRKGVYTVLLAATDKDGTRTDTMMVACYDTAEQTVGIVSVPRDTLIARENEHPHLVYGKGGVEQRVKDISDMLGVPIDGYVKVNIKGFITLVDYLKGVDIEVPLDMNYDDPYQDLHIHLKKGVQLLDGEKAMEMVRFRRYSEGDIKRVEMQQNFMKALIKECLSIKHWGKIKSYIDLAMENVQTDLEFGSVVWFAANVLGLNSGVPALNMDDVYTCTIPGDYWGEAYSRSTHQNQSYVTIYPKQVVELVNERFNPYEQRVTTSMLDAMSILSNGNIASSTGSLRDTTHNAVVSEMRGGGGKKDDTAPPKTEGPKQDEDGSYYVTDEDGKKVYTDKDGKPLDEANEPVLPGGIVINNPTDGNSQGSQGGSTPSEPGTSEPPEEGGQTAEPGDTAGNGDQEPVLPPEGDTEPAPDPMPDPVPEPPAPEPVPEPAPDPVIDTEIPGWLLT